MKQYLELVKKILDIGINKTDRTGVGTRSLVGETIRFDLRKGFPLLTTKKVPLKIVVIELLFFLQGRTNNNWLKERGCHIWDEWEYNGNIPWIENGELGPIYGKMWREWPIDSRFLNNDDSMKFDQLLYIMDQLEKHSRSRRILVSAWNPLFMPDETNTHNENIENNKQVLSPCHTTFQFIVEPNNSDVDYLNLVMYQRSADVALGVPFNIASYSFLLELMAKKYNYISKDLVIHFGDSHVYMNQIDGLKEQLNREPRNLPNILIKNNFAKDFLTFDPLNKKADEIYLLIDYNPHPAIRFPDPAV